MGVGLGVLCNGRVDGCVGKQLGVFVDEWVRTSSTRGTGRENDNVIAVKGGRLGVGGGCQWIHDWLSESGLLLSAQRKARGRRLAWVWGGYMDRYVDRCGVGIWIGT